MAFVPRLPTWIATFTPYLWDADTETWAVGVPFEGQLYTFKRVAEVLGFEAMYVVYPKEEVQLRCPTQLTMLGRDVIHHTWEGEEYYWWINQMVPRWMGFPNEHRLALLERLPLSFVEDLLANLQTVDVGLSSVDIDPDTILGDDTDTSLITVTLLDSASSPISGKSVVITTTGAGTLDSPNGVTDASGQYTTTYHSPVEETATFSADVPSQSITIGPSATLTVTGVPDATLSTIFIPDTTADADGVDGIGITVTVLDAGSNPLAGILVTLTTSSGTAFFDPVSADITDVNGQIFTNLRSLTPESGITVSADMAGITTADSPFGPLEFV